MRGDAWPLLQRAAAATIAWLLARQIGTDPEPFFAPIAAVVSLNTTIGERGLNAFRLLLGVVVGIVAGELTLLVLKGGYDSLAVATFGAMVVARAFGGPPLVVGQAAAGAILTVALADGAAGSNRLLDALIGAGVALVFSQLLFSPEPVRLLRRAESAALSGMADGLRLTARALAHSDEAAAEQAMDQLRDLRDLLVALGRTRTASTRVARHSLVWRSRIAPAVHEQENAGQLDLLGLSCLVLTRTALAADPADARRLADAVGGLADLLAELAAAPGDTSVRQGVVDRISEVLRDLDGVEAASGPSLRPAMAALRMVTADIMLFAGVEPAEVAAANRGEGSAPRTSVGPRPRPTRVPLLSRLSRQRRDQRDVGSP